MKGLLSVRRYPGAILGLWLLAVVTLGAAPANPKRVLLLDPYGNEVAPFSVALSAFRTTLAREVGERLEFYEVSLDRARFQEPEAEGSLLEFLESRLANRPVDLVATIGGPGLDFVGRHHERLFPDAPLLFMAGDPEATLTGSLAGKAAQVTLTLNLAGMVEDILQLQPSTTNIAVVFGASALESATVAQCRREFERFTNQVAFTWLNDLPLDQILERCAHLPPRSFVLHGLFLVDAAGVPFDRNEPLRRLHAVANAPIFAYFASELGLGSVGGRLFPDAEVGAQAAHAAIRILRGASPGDLPVQLLPEAKPTYDWRELRRWGLSESRLPPGSLIRFREPSLWERYRWPITGLVAVCLFQAALIISLLLNQARRRQSEEKTHQLSLALEQSPVLVLITDLEGRIIYVNRKFTETTGYSVGECLGRNPRILKSGECPPTTYQELWACITRGGIWQGEFHNRKKNGELYWERAVISPLLDAAGNITHYVGIKEDITERKRTEEALRASEARLAAGTELAGLGYYEVHYGARTCFLDDRFRDICGVPPSLAHSFQAVEFWSQHVHADDLPLLAQERQKLHGGLVDCISLEYRYQHPARGLRWLHHAARCAGCSAGSDQIRTVGVIRDITQQKRAEHEAQELRSNLTHLSRVNTIGALSGSLAHELNQPLGIILSNAQAAQDLLGQQPPDLVEVQAILTDIIAADRRAGEVIERLRTLLKRGQLSLQPLPLNQVIEEVLHLTRADLIGRGITVINQLAPDLPNIAGDRVQLQQFVLNLILNAIDAMATQPPGSRRLHLHTRPLEGLVRASVRDEGEGLPPDPEQLFQPFYTTKPQGLGLGLAICRSIMAAHHGRLWAEPHPERGAVFHFELPVAEKGLG